MRRIVLSPFIALGLGAAVMLNLPASADTKTYNFSGFSKVSASAGVSVVLKQGPYAISAEGSAKALERLRIETKGDTLEVGRKPNTMGWGSSSGRVTVTVSSPTYKGVSSSSGSDVDASGLNMAGASDLSVSSGARLDLGDVSLEDVRVTLSSGSSADVSGSCRSIRVDVSSGASFNGKGLKCETAIAGASSGASVHVWASKSAEGGASSGGSVNIHGDPATVDRDTSSGGSVNVR
jgi:hypothetical protein